MNKTCLKMVALACIFNSSFAFSDALTTENYPYKSAKDDFYFGLGAGATFNKLNFHILNTTSSFLTQIDANNSHALGNVFAGYGFTGANQLYVGGEVGTYFPKRRIDFNRSSVVEPHPLIVDKQWVEDYVTGDILPGFRCHDFLIYGRLGLAYSHLKFHQDAAIISPVFESQSNQLSKRLGLGINYAATYCLSIGADYIYMDYQVDDKFFPGFPALAKVKLNTSYVGLSLVYSV